MSNLPRSPFVQSVFSGHITLNSVAAWMLLEHLESWLSLPWGHNEYIILLTLLPNYWMFLREESKFEISDILEFYSINDGVVIEKRAGKKVLYSGHITLDRLVNIDKNKRQHAEQFMWNFKSIKRKRLSLSSAPGINIRRMHSELFPARVEL